MLKENLNRLFSVDFVWHWENEHLAFYKQIHEEIENNLNFHSLLNDNETKVKQFLFH